MLPLRFALQPLPHIHRRPRAGRFSALGLGQAGIYGIVTTQSNDFALGLPVLNAM
jgi:hypothetical protein